MRHILLTLIFTLLTFSLVVAQETKPPDQKADTPTTAETEKPKNEVQLMLEDIKKRGDIVLGVCTENCDSKRLLTGEVINGKALHLAKPEYPRLARMASAQGEVKVQVIIDEDGAVIRAAAVSGHPLLYAVSVAAARETKFTPTLLEGKPVKVAGVISYNFVAQ